MSTLAKLAFAGACVFTLSAMGFVHYRQIEDRHLLHQGIVRDIESQQKRKFANQYNLQTQIDITKRLKEQQERASLEKEES